MSSIDLTSLHFTSGCINTYAVSDGFIMKLTLINVNRCLRTWAVWGCSISQRRRGHTPASASSWCSGNCCWSASVSSRTPAPPTRTAGSPEQTGKRTVVSVWLFFTMTNCKVELPRPPQYSPFLYGWSRNSHWMWNHHRLVVWAECVSVLLAPSP